MEEMRYTISDAAKIVKVESHVLRYWEDELSLDIPRNEMGHRYYTKKEIDIFCQIRAFKERGFQLKSIKDVMEIMFDDEKTTNIISLEDVRQNFEEVIDKQLKNEGDTDQKDEKEEIKTVELFQDLSVENVSPEEKISHFKYIMDGIISQALRANNTLLEDELVEMVADRLMHEMGVMEQQREQREEERYRTGT